MCTMEENTMTKEGGRSENITSNKEETIPDTL
jgi:hypothetical protein